MARSRVEGIIMPTERLIHILRRMVCDTFRKLEDAVRDFVPQYALLFKGTDQFMDGNPGMQAEGILDIMVSVVRYTFFL